VVLRTFSQARAWRPAVVARLARTLGLRMTLSMTIPSEIQDLIDGSGNNFHAKVAQWFVADGWDIQISPYYLDQTQQKAREIDLVAEKPWPYKNGFGQHEGYILVRLYVECKFVPSHAVFWFAEKSKRDAAELVNSFPGFTLENSYSAEHHYLAQSARVAKLFTSSQTKQQESDLFYKALNQILSAYVAFRGQSLDFSNRKKKLHGNVLSLTYPVVVCSTFDKLFAADFLGKIKTTPQEENFQLEVRYAYGDSQNQRNEYFLVDFVSYDNLKPFTNALENDVNAAITLNSSC
jgi:hypothetical protein